jgi:RNA polymerase sigma factor (sigma-70 family)
MLWMNIHSTSLYTSGFTVSSTSHSVRRHGEISVAPLSVSSTKDNASTTDAFDTKPRSDAEQRELLRHVAESKRIRAVEATLDATSSSYQTLQEQRAAAAGYPTVSDYHEALERGHEARQVLVTSNMGLVHYCLQSVLRERTLQSLSRDDLIQEGCLGLARAIDKWNVQVGGKFSTYAVYWIRAAMVRALWQRNDFVRLPEHVHASMSKIQHAAAALGISVADQWDDGTTTANLATPSVYYDASLAQRIADEAGLSTTQVSSALQAYSQRKLMQHHRPLSLEGWMQHKGKVYGTVEEAASFVEEGNWSSLSRFLRPREMQALSLRYGLETAAEAPAAAPTTTLGRWGEARSFAQVGQCMSVSAEYGRRLCHGALQKLRAAAAAGMLEPQALSLVQLSA